MVNLRNHCQLLLFSHVQKMFTHSCFNVVRIPAFLALSYFLSFLFNLRCELLSQFSPQVERKCLSLKCVILKGQAQAKIIKKLVIILTYRYDHMM